MPSFSYTPGTLTLTGAEIFPIPIRLTYTAGALALTGGSYTSFGPNLTVTDGDRLPRLNRGVSYFDKSGAPTQQMQSHWQRFAERIEARFTDIEDVLAQIQQAQATAADAKQTADATATADALNKSFPSPSTILSATSAGTITITAHTRIYGDGTSVAVDGGSLSGWSQGQFVQVYYDDAARAGGAVSYQGTTDVIAQAGSRHIVGGVAIPLAGELPVDGYPPFPPGYVPDTRGLQ